ncbi:hypothetical protein MTO96_017489 [Rhipicephalus appendiculatus]
MNSFCGSPLWDNSLTWDAETPDFTPCFQETVLVWVPCLFLWLTCPFDIVAFKRSRNPPLPWTFLNIAKVLLSVVLIVTSVVEIAQALTRYADGQIVFPVEYYAPVIRMVTFLLAVVLVTTARRRGICTSGPLFIFWLLMSLASIVRYRSVILQVFSEDVGSTSDEQMEFRFVTIVVYCPVIVGQFLLSCFADTAQPVSGSKRAMKQCPESRSSFLSKLLFWWFNGYAAGREQDSQQTQRGDWTIVKTGTTTVAAAILAAAEITSEESAADTIWPSTQQNIVVVSTTNEDNAARYAKIQEISIQDKPYEVSAYRTAPDDTVKGVIRGIPADANAEELDRNTVNESNPLTVGAKRIGSTTTAIVVFQGPKAPNFVRYRVNVIPCRLYKKQIDVCQQCGRVGHRKDVCPTSTIKTCLACGLADPK